MPLLEFTFQESSPLISYSPGWDGIYDHNDPFKNRYDGIFRPTSKPGTTATLSFLGTGVSIFGALRDNHGDYSVVLDNDSANTFTGNGFAPNPFLFNTSLWNRTGLPYTQHTVTLTNIPTDARPFVDIDYITIERSIGGPEDTIFNFTVDDTSSQSVSYVGAWQEIPQATAFNSTLHRTSAPGAQVIIQFNGCCIEVYGQYANANFSATVDDQTPTPLAGFDVDLPNTDQQPQTLLYLVDNLDNGKEHKVTLTNTDSNDGRPLYFDYAIVRSTQNLLASGPNQGSGPDQNPTTNSDATRGPDTDSKGHVPTAAIVVAVLGAVAIALLLFFAYYCLKRRKRSTLSDVSSTTRSNLKAEPYILPYYANSNNGVPTYNPSSTTTNPTHESSTVSGSETFSSVFGTTYSTARLSSYTHTEGPFPSTASTSAMPGGRREKGVLRPTPEETSPIQERDAGAVPVPSGSHVPRSHLPPAYDPSWVQDPSRPS